MIPWQHVDDATTPDGKGKLILQRRDGEFSIRTGGTELMNSRVHGSEEAMARLACDTIASHDAPTVLVGGLGMGYTLAAALSRLPRSARVVVAELVPAVVEWNQKVLAHLANHPLRDARVEVRTRDVGDVMRERSASFDAIMLDVDNGPDGLTQRGNNRLYTRAGLVDARRALRLGGVFAVWSAGPDSEFRRRLDDGGFEVAERRVRARPGGRGSTHTVWIARRRPDRAARMGGRGG